MKSLLTQRTIETRILVIRNQRVMIDRDLAELYNIETKHLNRQVRRNKERFPREFAFILNTKEKNELVTKCHRFKSMKHSNSLPYAFTEHGVAMLATVLNSGVAIKMSIEIVKTVINLREITVTHKRLARKLQKLENEIGYHDKDIKTLFYAISNRTNKA